LIKVDQNTEPEKKNKKLNLFEKMSDHNKVEPIDDIADDIQSLIRLVKENSNRLDKLSNLTERHSKQLVDHKIKMVISRSFN